MARDVRFAIIADDRASRTLKGVGDEAERSGGKLRRFGALARTGLLAAAAAVGVFGVQSVQAYSESEQAQGRLSDAFSRFPKLADLSVDALRDYNSELARKVRFDDDAFASGQSVLASFGVTGAQLKTLTPLLADYAAKTGKDLPTAASDLGKALQGQGRALKAVGLNFKGSKDAGENYEQLVAGLRKQVGGFASKEGQTFQGRLSILKNQFGELQETVGAKLVPVLSRFLGWVLDRGIPGLQRFGEWVGPKLQAAARVLQSAIGQLRGEFGRNSETMRNATQLAQLAVVVFQKLAPVVGPVLMAAIQGQINVWRGYALVFNNVVMPAIRGFVAVALAQFGLLINGAAKVFGWIPGVGPRLRAAAEEFNAFRNRVNSALSGIRDRNVRVTVNGKPVSVNYRSDGSVRMSNGAGGFVTARASGGPVQRGGWSVVGENGPELVNWRGDGRVYSTEASRALMGGGGGASVTVNVSNAVVGNEREIARVVTDAVRTATRQGLLRGIA